MADTGVLHFDETFARFQVFGLDNRVIGSEFNSTAGIGDHSSLLNEGDVRHGGCRLYHQTVEVYIVHHP